MRKRQVIEFSFQFHFNALQLIEFLIGLNEFLGKGLELFLRHRYSPCPGAGERVVTHLQRLQFSFA